VASRRCGRGTSRSSRLVTAAATRRAITWAKPHGYRRAGVVRRTTLTGLQRVARGNPFRLL
jgi:hypothetical protein